MSFESPIPNDPLQSSLDIDPRVTSSLLWVSWLVGTAMLAAVIAVALHLSDVEAFGTLLERAEPLWLIVAIVLQALTYLAQGQVFRGVLKAGHAQLSLDRKSVV